MCLSTLVYTVQYWLVRWLFLETAATSKLLDLAGVEGSVVSFELGRLGNSLHVTSLAFAFKNWWEPGRIVVIQPGLEPSMCRLSSRTISQEINVSCIHYFILYFSKFHYDLKINTHVFCFMFSTRICKHCSSNVHKYRVIRRFLRKSRK
jgi:hypothetical protein